MNSLCIVSIHILYMCMCVCVCKGDNVNFEKCHCWHFCVREGNRLGVLWKWKKYDEKMSLQWWDLLSDALCTDILFAVINARNILNKTFQAPKIIRSLNFARARRLTDFFRTSFYETCIIWTDKTWKFSTTFLRPDLNWYKILVGSVTTIGIEIQWVQNMKSPPFFCFSKQTNIGRRRIRIYDIEAAGNLSHQGRQAGCLYWISPQVIYTLVDG